MAAVNQTKKLLLFDIDGTLTLARGKITPEMKKHLLKLKEKFSIGVVGGSDFTKAREQLGEDILETFDYVFSENGLVHYKDGLLIHKKSLLDYLSQEKLNIFISYVLKYISELKIPIKTGTFLEMRNGMMNISPIGRNCTQAQRDEFERYDNKEHVREIMIKNLKEEFPEYHFDYSIGGQISFDVFPTGLNKTFCLPFVTKYHSEIHFFGDKTEKGGNDYELFINPSVTSHKVTSWKDTFDITLEL
jgi:phosphomannomutase